MSGDVIFVLPFFSSFLVSFQLYLIFASCWLWRGSHSRLGPATDRVWYKQHYKVLCMKFLAWNLPLSLLLVFIEAFTTIPRFLSYHSLADQTQHIGSENFFLSHGALVYSSLHRHSLSVFIAYSSQFGEILLTLFHCSIFTLVKNLVSSAPFLYLPIPDKCLWNIN